MTQAGGNASAAADLAARTSYGRLLAYLCSRSRDIQACEDALAEAFRAALERWPQTGVPDNPDAWLLTTARNRLVDAARHAKVFRDSVAGWLGLDAEGKRDLAPSPVFGDERLKLLFICAHPSIEASIRTPLMLQTVLGLEAGEIASSFLTSPAAMSKRLARAKGKIKEARPDFEVPEARELPDRLDFVLEAIFAAYGKSWRNFASGAEALDGLDSEALYLADVTATLLPDHPEALGLCALLLHCEARKAARRSPEGEYVPLDEQDISRWDWRRVGRAEALLEKAAALGRFGRFQLEAAIQSAHCARLSRKIDNQKDIVVLYEALVARFPTLGARLGRAAAIGRAQGPEAGLRALDGVAEDTRNHQPFWALRASLLREAGRAEEARMAYHRAIGLTEDPAVRAFLRRKSLEIEMRTPIPEL